MYSKRFGHLQPISDHTDGDCHLCHEPAPIELYGAPGTYGDDTVTVDHLEPQYFGGDDDIDNLRLAHAVCNSIRGVRDAEDVRMELAGTERAPMSRGEKNTLAVGGGFLVALIAGNAAATTAPDGSRVFNGNAAAGWGILAGLLLASAL